jgi:HK97 family phage major capsid protein
MNVQDLNKRKNELYAAQEAILNSAQEAKRILTTVENENLDKHTNEIKDLDRQIALSNTIAVGRSELLKPTSQIEIPQGAKLSGDGKIIFSADYKRNFWSSFAKKGQFSNAALGEGGTTDGGNLVPITVDGTIVPLAPQENALRKLALVLETQNDIKLPAQLTRGVAAAKDESRTADHAFAGTDPSFTQVTLSAFMKGQLVPITIELAQDVPALEKFLVADLGRAINNYEEDKFANGSGTGEPEGILTGADAGQTNALNAANSLDFLGTLRAAYYANANFLMHRKTGIAFRKKQLTDNQFNQYWTTVGGQEYLHGFPVYYSSAFPVFVASPAVNGAIAFGDFNTAFTIGDRGGPGIVVSVDNITELKNGKINVIGYRRSDSRVRVSEAVKIWTING